jgi:hypothetical protein
MALIFVFNAVLGFRPATTARLAREHKTTTNTAKIYSFYFYFFNNGCLRKINLFL